MGAELDDRRREQLVNFDDQGLSLSYLEADKLYVQLELEHSRVS